VLCFIPAIGGVAISNLIEEWELAGRRLGTFIAGLTISC